MKQTSMGRVGTLSLAIVLAGASAASAADLLSGEWQGAYICRQGLTTLTLSIEPDGEQWAGTFSFGPVKGNKGVPHGAYALTITQDGDTYHFDPSGWIQQPPNYGMVGLDGTLSADSQALSGSVLFDGCQSFQVSRTTPLPPSKGKGSR